MLYCCARCSRTFDAELAEENEFRCLSKKCGSALVPLLIFIDAPDEANRDAFGRIPENLPNGVYVIATTRPVGAAGDAGAAGKPPLVRPRREDYRIKETSEER
jgi:hypothetical protein